MTVATHALSCDTTAARAARLWTADTLRALLAASESAARLVDDLVDDTILCVSELVTNALNAGCHEMTLRLRMGLDTLRISLIDDAPGRPVRRSPTEHEPSGRGLIIVSALAESWGVGPAPNGKETWAELGCAR
jgi:anti-sigma regulatory factor (Ser/Thr protein kinase)